MEIVNGPQVIVVSNCQIVPIPHVMLCFTHDIVYSATKGIPLECVGIELNINFQSSSPHCDLIYDLQCVLIDIFASRQQANIM